MARDKKLSPYAAASGGVMARPGAAAGGARRDGWAGGRVGPLVEPEPGAAPDDAAVLAGAEQAAGLLTTGRAPVADLTGEGPASAAERKSIRRQVLGLAWPVIVENLLQTMIGVVDTALVGHLTTDALAGVGGAQQLVWLVTTLLSSVMMGATVLVGRAIGARQRLDARAAFKQAVLVSMAVSVLIGAIIFIFGAPFM